MIATPVRDVTGSHILTDLTYTPVKPVSNHLKGNTK
jgi:hypothetical protein